MKKFTEIARLECMIGACPRIFRIECAPFPGCPSINLTDSNTVVVIGRLLSLEETNAAGITIGAGEAAVEIPAALFEKTISGFETKPHD